MKQVLVLDANQRCALAVTRSFGKHRISIITADETPSSLAGSSRYSKSYFSYPSPKTHPGQFIASVARIIKEQSIDIILPMTELTTTLLLKHKELLNDAILPFPDQQIVDSLADKCSLMRMAETLSIPYPRTWFVDHTERSTFDLNKLPYPLVLKPGKSWTYRDGEWSRNAVQFADSPSSAEHILKSDPVFSVHPFMLQQCVSGSGQGVFALYDRGRPLAFFAHRRLREKPPSGGVSVLSESIPINTDMLRYARALLDEAKWHGVAMVEFKVDDDNGTPYLMEVNTRFWGSLQLAIDAGVDFPWMLYQLACGEALSPSDDYIVGRRLRWLLGDLDNLYLTLRGGQYSVAEKLTAIYRFLTPSPFKTRHEVNRWGDLGPFWYELKHYVRDLIGK